jgi:hypothetical protein
LTKIITITETMESQTASDETELLWLKKYILLFIFFLISRLPKKLVRGPLRDHIILLSVQASKLKRNQSHSWCLGNLFIDAKWFLRSLNEIAIVGSKAGIALAQQKINLLYENFKKKIHLFYPYQ